MTERKRKEKKKKPWATEPDRVIDGEHRALSSRSFFAIQMFPGPHPGALLLMASHNGRWQRMLIHSAAVSLDGRNNRNEQVHYYLGPFNQINNNACPHFVPRIGVIQREWGSTFRPKSLKQRVHRGCWFDIDIYRWGAALFAAVCCCPTRLYQLLFGMKMWWKGQLVQILEALFSFFLF